MDRTIRCVAASESNPIAHHRAKADAAARYARDQAAVCWCCDFAQVDWDCAHHSADGEASYAAACEEHAHILRCGLNRDADCHNDTIQLHVSNAAKSISYHHLCKSASSFAGYVNRDNCSCKPVGRITHVINPAVVCNSCCCDACVESEEECPYSCKINNTFLSRAHLYAANTATPSIYVLIWNARGRGKERVVEEVERRFRQTLTNDLTPKPCPHVGRKLLHVRLSKPEAFEIGFEGRVRG